MSSKRGRLGRTMSSSLSQNSLLSKHHKNRFHYFNNKKGQVTVFIIIGIALLFSFAGVLYVTKIVQKDKITEEGFRALEDVPSQFRSVRTYTEDCLRETAEKGLKILGQQGGYIYVDLIGTYDPENPTNADGVNLGNMKVPYWHYSRPENQLNVIAYSSLKPKLYDDGKEGSEMSIESQLSRYVKEHIQECLADYTQFKEQGIVVETSLIQDAQAQVGEESVVFTINLDVKASQGEAQEQFNQFFVRVPLNLKHYYDVASNIAESQKNYFFLEAQFLSLLGSFTSLADNMLPPMNAATFDVAGTKFWQTPDVEEKLQQLISSYIPMLQVLGAHNLQYYDYPVTDLSSIYQQNYNNNIITNINDVEDVEVRFDYFGWKPYFDFNDVDGMITSQNTLHKRWFVVLGVQRYYTTYDVSYPVLVTIDDPLALDNEGYKFIFALESNIRNSDPVRTDQTLPPPVSSFSESMVCDTNKRSSEVLRAKVVDSFTHEPLDLVRVGFTIPDQDECEMGVTDDSGELDKSYPEVYGGMMSFMKEDYLTSFYPIDTYDLPPSQNLIGYAVADIKEPVIELHKLKPINVTVQKKRISKCIIPLECFYTVGAIGLIPYKDITCKEAERRCFFDSKDSNTLFNSNPASSGPTSGSSGLFELPDHLLRKQVNDSLTKYNDYYFSETETSLSDDEDVLVVLRKVSDLNNGPMTEDQTIPIFINGPRSTEVKLVPGIYAVDAMLTLKKEINIATEERSVAFTIITWEKDFRYTLNGSKLEKFISGSLKWDEPKYYFEITPEELYTSDQLTFYVPSYAIEDVPLQVEVSSWECAAVVFGYPAAGCREKSVKVNGRLMEDLMMMTDMSQISKEKRKSLDPLWN